MCSPGRGWVYSRWFPNNKINSAQVLGPPLHCTIHKLQTEMPHDMRACNSMHVAENNPGYCMSAGREWHHSIE